MIQEIKGGYVKHETHYGITTIEFHHPQGNSLPGSLLEQLTNAVHGAGNEEDTKVIVIRSVGDGAFCAGASFDELKSITTEEQGFAFFSGFANLINAMRKCPQFIITRVHGKCVGGGVGIAAASDYVIAAEGADIKLSEFSLGFGPFVVGPAIEKRIGTTSFSHLAIDSVMWRSADWARRKGLYSELHPTVADMDESLLRLANSLSHANPKATKELKKIFWQGSEHWDKLLYERAAISGKMILGEHFRKAIDGKKK